MERSNSLSILNIAVVGSGISGLSAAWLLSRGHAVTLFEAEDRFGGHSNTVECRTAQGTVAVDTGFIVFNRETYPNLAALFGYLGVATVPAQMGFGVSLAGGRCEYSGGGILQMLGGFTNLFNPGHWRMLRDLIRFFRHATVQSHLLSDNTTLGQFIAEQGYSQDFATRHLLPMAGAIWSAPPQQMLDYPARSFLRFFDNHGLLKFTNRPRWQTVTGGSRQYVQKLMADSSMRVLKGCPVQSVNRFGHHVVVRCKNGFNETFDHVVIATHADQALAMLTEPTINEQRCLSAFRYARNRAVLHRDASLMPRRRRLWSSWNVLSDGQMSTHPCGVTYWMNALQPLATATDLFVTLNPHREPADGTVERVFSYEHPIFCPETARQQERLWDLQGARRTWFCGAYFGAGFHEDGLQSGLAAAEQLGGMPRPWDISGPSNRIHIGAPPLAPEGARLEAAE